MQLLTGETPPLIDVQLITGSLLPLTFPSLTSSAYREEEEEEGEEEEEEEEEGPRPL